MASAKAKKYWTKQGENFMTPEILDYYESDDGKLIEFSSGTRFDKTIWGVSVADAEGNRLYEPDSQMLHTWVQAQTHIAKLGA